MLSGKLSIFEQCILLKKIFWEILTVYLSSIY